MDNLLEILKTLSENGFDIASIIVGVAIAIVGIYWKSIVGAITKRSSFVKDNEMLAAEKYSIASATQINLMLQSVASKDADISNIILCNYHNGISSNTNFSYYHFTSICEYLGNTTNQCFDVWREKSYTNYQPELQYIHNNRTAIIDLDSKEDVEAFPKLSKLIADSDAKVGFLIPISGIHSGLGMMVVLYNEHKEIEDRSEYIYNISTELERLAVLLDYRSHLKSEHKKRKR